MGVFVKICGMANAEDVQAVAALKPDAMGFVFWAHSPRCAKPGDVGGWTKELAGILKVGVFVDAGPEEIREAVGQAKLDVIQLHVFRPGGQVQSLEESRPSFPNIGKKRMWQVVHLDRERPEAEPAGPVDAYLIDRYSPKSPGGTGQTVDWAVAREFVKRAPKPVLLAGGLTPDNVAEAIRQVRPWGVDVCSGVEERPGKKDLEKVRRFIEQCRSH